MMRCALCGHDMTDLDVCGSGAVWNGNVRLDLCHADDHDCYRAWTVYGKRPGGAIGPVTDDLSRYRAIGFMWDGKVFYFDDQVD